MKITSELCCGTDQSRSRGRVRANTKLSISMIISTWQRIVHVIGLSLFEPSLNVWIALLRVMKEDGIRLVESVFVKKRRMLSGIATLA
ncbi:hypothetical protein QZ995_11605 [Brevibacillus laterosporus]|nr:hypothetical protein [Brevibacillus laterosporus]